MAGTNSANGSALSLKGLSKRFAAFTAVDGIDLDVLPGQLMALLGPSGCGKTTTLRMVAGLERPTEGDILYGNRYLVSTAQAIELPPDKRNVGMVFQSYALWPHMTVFENVAYPLKLRRVSKAEIRQRVEGVLNLMNLGALRDKTIPQLSGGQQQRVALARALVYEPSLMLFDEPFSNLDTQLRTQMRLELKHLRRKIAMTGLFVTDDQVEALSMADCVAIMNGGRIEQVGTPQDVYTHPKTRFVRDFLGRVISLHGRLDERGGKWAVRLGDGEATLDCSPTVGFKSGDRVELSIRPEYAKHHPVEEKGLPNAIPARIEELLFTGDQFEARLAVVGENVLFELPSSCPWREGDVLALELPAEALSIWPFDASE